MQPLNELWLVRHGETPWSLSGAHTSRTEIALTSTGRLQAAAIGQQLKNVDFSLVLSSPRFRALETCRIAGYSDIVQVDENLTEWDYGSYEGLTTAQIRETMPSWLVWDGPIPGGETLEDVKCRADKVIDRVLAASGRVVLFSHAHILRILAASWIRLSPHTGRSLFLSAGSVSTLGFEHGERAILSWNQSFGEQKV